MKRASHTTSLLALCAGPVLLAGVVFAGPSDDYLPPSPATSGTAPTPMADSYDSPTEIYPEITDPYAEAAEEEMFGEYEDPTPAPVEMEREETSSPTEMYVETTDEGEMYYMPVGEDGDEEEQDTMAMPMDEKPEGASCSTYDEDVSTTILFTTGTYLLFLFSFACSYEDFGCMHRLPEVYRDSGGVE